MNFTKMQGTGNDFIVIEDLEDKYKGMDSALAKKLCNRNFAVGGDGILIVRASTFADIQMVIINSDGSYAAMCGNGIRCFAKYVYDNNIVKKEKIKIETGDGIKEALIKSYEGKAMSVTINMGTPSFEPKEIPAISENEIINKEVIVNNKKYSLISMLLGVPHTVIIGKLYDFDVQEGKYIEKYNELFPQGTNVNFCEVLDKGNIKVKTWERGAGPTLACGTGSCAAVVASYKLGLINNEVKVEVQEEI